MTDTRPPVSRLLSLAQLAGSVGDGAYYVCSALYFTTVVGLSPGAVGLGLTAAWGVGALAGVPVGRLADRVGPRRVAVALALVTAAAVGLYPWVGSFAGFAAVACVYACGQSGLHAARQALLAGAVAPERRTRVRARLQAVSNLGLAVGAGIGGVALAVDERAAYVGVFALDVVGFVVAAALLWRVPGDVAVGRAVVAPAPSTGVLRDRGFVVVTLVNMVMLLNMPLLSVVLPLWIATRTTAPGWLVSVMFVMNTLGVVLFQVRAARRVRGLADAVRHVRVAGVLMGAACGVYAVSGFGGGGGDARLAATALLVAGAVQVVGELVHAAGAWEIGFGLAPEGRQGEYQGLFGSGVAVARMVGPASLTWLVLGWGGPGWLVLGGVFVAAGVGMGVVVRRRGRGFGAAGIAGGEVGPDVALAGTKR